MSERHWKQIAEKTGIEVIPGPDFNFQKILDLKLDEHLETCVTIGERAFKEHLIEV
jgi:hypothetical protein